MPAPGLPGPCGLPSSPVGTLLAVGCGALGLAVGPALNRVIERVPRREPLLGGDGARIPVVPRSGREAVVDVAAAGLFAAAAARFGADWALPAYLVFFAAILTVSMIDLEHYLIPNRVIYPSLALAVPLLVLAAAAEHRWAGLERAGMGAALGGGMLLVVHLVSPQGMGFGDVRLAFVLGLFLGWLDLSHVVLGLFLGFLLGAVAGVILMAARKRTGKDAIPFGPFLAMGAAIAVLAGSPLLRWYLG